MSPAVPVVGSNAGGRYVNGVEKILSRNEQTLQNTHHQVEHHEHERFHHINRHCLASSPCISPQTPCNHYRQDGTLNLTASLLCAITPDALAHEDSQICRVPRRRSKHCSMFHHVDDSRKRHDDRLNRGPGLRLMVPGSKADNCCDADVFSFGERQFRVGNNFFGGRERRLELPDFSARVALEKCRFPAPVERTLVS